MALEVGSRLGPYSVTAKIGEDGMARCIERKVSHRDLEAASMT